MKRHIAVVMSQSGAEAGAMIVVSMLVARWFGSTLFGQLGMLLAGVQLITTVCDGFTMSLVRFVSRAYLSDGPKGGAITGWQLAWLATFIHFLLAIITGLAGWAVTGFNASSELIFFAVLLATFRAARSIFDSAFRGLKAFKIPAIMATTCTAVAALLIIVFTANGYGVAAYLALLALGTIVNVAGLAYIYYRKFGDKDFTFFPSRAQTRDYLDYSYPLALRGLSGFFFLKINIWIIGWLATAADAGQFRLTDLFLTVPTLIFSSVIVAVAPRIAEAQEAGLESLSLMCAKMHGLMVLIGTPLTLFFLFNGLVLDLVFPGYEMASTMLMIFAPAYFLRGIANSASVILVQGGKPKVAFWLSFIPSVANLIFAFVGFMIYGTIGLTVATSLVHCLSYLATIITTHRIFKIPFRLRFG